MYSWCVSALLVIQLFTKAIFCNPLSLLRLFASLYAFLIVLYRDFTILFPNFLQFLFCFMTSALTHIYFRIPTSSPTLTFKILVKKTLKISTGKMFHCDITWYMLKNLSSHIYIPVGYWFRLFVIWSSFFLNDELSLQLLCLIRLVWQDSTHFFYCFPFGLQILDSFGNGLCFFLLDVLCVEKGV